MLNMMKNLLIMAVFFGFFVVGVLYGRYHWSTWVSVFIGFVAGIMASMVRERVWPE
jgi:hypothetical protein